jgi:hypothetical protein
MPVPAPVTSAAPEGIDDRRVLIAISSSSDDALVA